MEVMKKIEAEKALPPEVVEPVANSVMVKKPRKKKE
jgi:hypothetical protein